MYPITSVDARWEKGCRLTRRQSCLTRTPSAVGSGHTSPSPILYRFDRCPWREVYYRMTFRDIEWSVLRHFAVYDGWYYYSYRWQKYLLLEGFDRESRLNLKKPFNKYLIKSRIFMKPDYRRLQRSRSLSRGNPYSFTQNMQSAPAAFFILARSSVHFLLQSSSTTAKQ